MERTRKAALEIGAFWDTEHQPWPRQCSLAVGLEGVVFDALPNLFYLCAPYKNLRAFKKYIEGNAIWFLETNIEFGHEYGS